MSDAVTLRQDPYDSIGSAMEDSTLQLRMAAPVNHLSTCFINLATCKLGYPTFFSEVKDSRRRLWRFAHLANHT